MKTNTFFPHTQNLIFKSLKIYKNYKNVFTQKSTHFKFLICFNFQLTTEDLSEDLHFENVIENNISIITQGNFENVSGLETTEIIQNEASLSKRPQRELFVSPQKPLKKKKWSSDDHKLDIAWNTLQSFITTKKTKDQFDAFGQYISEKLRQLDTETGIGTC